MVRRSANWLFGPTPKCLAIYYKEVMSKFHFNYSYFMEFLSSKINCIKLFKTIRCGWHKKQKTAHTKFYNDQDNSIWNIYSSKVKQNNGSNRIFDNMFQKSLVLCTCSSELIWNKKASSIFCSIHWGKT